MLSNAVDPGWVRTHMGGASAPVDILTGRATQSWLAASEDDAARTSGGYWQAMQRKEPPTSAASPDHGDRLIAAIEALTGVTVGASGQPRSRPRA
ncbi:hypothetical protein HHL08_19720 [Sphingobium sp. AR-3-1]|uniref:Uncharacterized protein n=1 Tax=Sphingobium psychrophilum TaxID=2728834 RepID=A0A7X9ZU59_9SPHN|nr:hypothetical protein [Sphingobium psychrophilum]NML12337.1 hypothetical protein [Sphingobium psychrophilum]